MLIFFGERWYGRVAERGNEFVLTKFAHLWFLPLVPSESRWSHRVGYATHGFEIQTDFRSVFATYLRWYAPVIAAAVVYRAPLVVGVPVGSTLALAIAWAWSIRWLRGARARKRSDWDLLAFRTRCDPALMLQDHRKKLHKAFEDAWKLLGRGRSPEDVARFGAVDAKQAVCAYGLLRLAAAARGGREALELADRISDGTFEPTADDGPYRTAAGVAPGAEPAPPASSEPAASEDDDDDEGEWDTACGDKRCDGILGVDERCTVCGLTYDDGEAAAARWDKAARDEEIAARRRAALESANHLLLPGVLVGVLALAGGVFFFVLPVLSRPTAITFDDLERFSDTGRDVTVTCDRAIDVGNIARTSRAGRGSDGRETAAPITETYAVAMCGQGSRVLPVLHDVDAAQTLVFTGRVNAADHKSEPLYALVPAEPKPLPYYLAPRSPSQPRGVLVLIGLTMLAFSVGAIGKGLRDRRRAQRIAA